MKTFAIYNKDGVVKKVIRTTRNDVIERNVPKDHEYIEVSGNIKSGYLIKDGKVIPTATANTLAKQAISIFSKK